MGINDALMEATKQLVDNPSNAVKILDGVKKMLISTRKPKAKIYAVRAKALSLEIAGKKRPKYNILIDIAKLADEIKKDKIE